MQTVDSPRPRGRPRSFDTDLVLDQALEVFWAKGYDGASLDDLTAAMGLSRPSVYAAFGDKHSLFLAVLDRYVATLGRTPLTAMLSEADAVQGMHAFLRATIDLAVCGSVPKGCLIACVASEVAVSDHGARARVSKAMSDTAGAIGSYLRERHQLEPQEMEALTHVLMALMHSLAIRARAGTPRDELERSAGSAVELLVKRVAQPRG